MDHCVAPKKIAHFTPVAWFVFFLLVLLFSQPVRAAGYMDSVRKDQECANYGETAKVVYRTGLFHGYTIKDLAEKRRKGEITTDVFQRLMTIHFIMVVDSPQSAHDAYMLAWANCMDWK